MSLSILVALRIAKDMQRGMLRPTTVCDIDARACLLATSIFSISEKRDPDRDVRIPKLGRSIGRNSAVPLR